MKKIFLVFATTFLISSLLHSQEVHFGIKAGLNSSNLNVENSGDYDSKLGFNVGGLAHIHISRHFAVQPELVFSTQGGKGDAGTTKLSYVNVPVLAQFMFGEGFRLQTGPQVGFLLAAKIENGDTETDIDDVFSTIDVSWSVGAGYLFPQGLGIDARYNIGLTDIYESDLYEVKNNVFQVGLFYQFMHNKSTRPK
jgi:hypothetical protein